MLMILFVVVVLLEMKIMLDVVSWMLEALHSGHWRFMDVSGVSYRYDVMSCGLLFVMY